MAKRKSGRQRRKAEAAVTVTVTKKDFGTGDDRKAVTIHPELLAQLAQQSNGKSPEYLLDQLVAGYLKHGSPDKIPRLEKKLTRALGNALLTPIEKMDEDFKEVMGNIELALEFGDIRFLVDLFYQMQDVRKALREQLRSMDKEPSRLVEWMFLRMEELEGYAKKLLKKWVEQHPPSVWACKQHGIDAVLAAGLAAHIDMSRVQYAGQIWRFAGQDDPARYKWCKKEDAHKIIKKHLVDGEITQQTIIDIAEEMCLKADRLYEQAADNDDGVTVDSLARIISRRPFNQWLKTHCWKIGIVFRYNWKHPDCKYGKVYGARKIYEQQRNQRGENAEEAKRTLATKNIRKKDTRAAYEAGRLPDERIDLRARRKAVQLFLSHWFEVAYKYYNAGKEPPMPYPIAHLGHYKWIQAEKAE